MRRASSREFALKKRVICFLSFWDYLFGTIYVPKVREELSVGVAEKDYDNIWQLYYLPFIVVIYCDLILQRKKQFMLRKARFKR